MSACRLGREHGPVSFDQDSGYFCPGCGEPLSPSEVREWIAELARQGGMLGHEGIADADGHVLMSADPDAINLSEDPEIVAAFVAAINAAGSQPVRWHYLAWSGCPGRDWAEPRSLASRERGSVRHCRESARVRHLRACMRAHPSDGPPAGVAALGAPVISP